MDTATMKDVTLLCMHGDKDFRLLKYAMDVCQSYYRFGDVRCYTSKDAPHVDPSYPGTIVLEKAFSDMWEPVYFISSDIIPAIRTEYVLFIQWDGYILNPRMWTDEFRKYDVIGAPWPWIKERNVGSGGFVWWSQTFMQARVAWEKKNKPNWHNLPNEDWYLYHEHCSDFQENGVKFAPEALADQFAVECKGGGKSWAGNTFGFHDFRHVKLDTWQSPVPIPEPHRGRIWAAHPDAATKPDGSSLQTAAQLSAQKQTNGRKATIVMILPNQATSAKPALESWIPQWHAGVDFLVLYENGDDDSTAVVRDIFSKNPNISFRFLCIENRYSTNITTQIAHNTDSEIIIFSGSGDLASPSRLDEVLTCFETTPDCHLMTSNRISMTLEGGLSHLEDTQQENIVCIDPLEAVSNALSLGKHGATWACRRSLLEDFPPLDPEMFCDDLDVLLSFRASLAGSHHYLSRPLVAGHAQPDKASRGSTKASEGQPFKADPALRVLKVLAQMLRDAQFKTARAPNPVLLEPIQNHCQSLFFKAFTEWSRYAGSKALSGGTSRATTPHRVSIKPGHRSHFGEHGRLGAAAATWSGFHASESAWNWTERRALIVLRVSASDDASLVIAFASLPFQMRQRFRFTIWGGASTACLLGAGEYTEISLPLSHSASCLVNILVEALDAQIPAKANVGIDDQRLLGAMLHWIEVRKVAVGPCP